MVKSLLIGISALLAVAVAAVFIYRSVVKENWTLVYYQAPNYDYTSDQKYDGYSSFANCRIAGRDLLSGSLDDREWYQCGKNCNYDYGEFVCKRVCYDSGDCRE